MRNFIDIVETAQKISFADAKKFLSNIEMGKGGMTEIGRTYPWLVSACQTAIQQRYGDRIDVYRSLTLSENRRPDGIASTTLDWKVACKIMDDAPGIVWHGDKTIPLTSEILHYTIAPEQVILWIPFAVSYVKTTIGKRTNHSIEDRYGTRIKLENILKFLEDEDEQEVVADLSGLTPKVLKFGNSIKERQKRTIFRSFMDGTLTRSNIEQWSMKYKTNFFDNDDIIELLKKFDEWHRRSGD